MSEPTKEYPLGGSLEPADIEKEKDLQNILEKKQKEFIDKITIEKLKKEFKKK